MPDTRPHISERSTCDFLILFGNSCGSLIFRVGIIKRERLEALAMECVPPCTLNFYSLSPSLMREVSHRSLEITYTIFANVFSARSEEIEIDDPLSFSLETWP